MSYFALLLGANAAFFAQVGHSSDAGAEETIVLSRMCGFMLLVGGVFLVLGRMPA